MGKFYFFKSSYEGDVMSGISVFTNSAKKAFKFAFNHFKKHKCKGIPVLMSI